MRSLVVALVALLALLAGCSNAAPAPAPAAPQQLRVGLLGPTPAQAGDDLSRLVVAPDVDAPGYDRDARFGKDWRSIGKGCDVRDAALAQDLTDETYKPGSTCDVTGGRLRGQPISASQVDIDHVIPLKLAWVSGAWRWTDAQRRDFANDLGELRVEPSASNRSDGALGPEASDPGGDRCVYARRYVLTVIKQNQAGLPLTVTQARKDALGKLLATC